MGPPTLDLTGVRMGDVVYVPEYEAYYDVRSLAIDESLEGRTADGDPQYGPTTLRLSLGTARDQNGDLRYGPDCEPPADVISLGRLRSRDFVINGCAYWLADVTVGNVFHFKYGGVNGDTIDLTLIRNVLNDPGGRPTPLVQRREDPAAG